jgi:ribonuclease D
MNKNVHFIDREEDFQHLVAELAQSEWFAYDTEFIGEKTYVPVLCLIQVLHGDQVYLIDPVTLPNMQPFADLIADPRILKITHAGDNDYRLLYQLYGVVPKNLFDTQVAAGFINYPYPTGFGRIVSSEIGIDLGKGYAVTQWDKRPLDEKVLQYAVEDVVYLRRLYEQMTKKLEKRQRNDWALEEIAKWENPAFYEVNPLRDIMSSDIIYRLRSEREQVFLYRLYEWRRTKSETENIPKEHSLPAKHISAIVRSMKDGKRSLQNNRTVPDHVWLKHFSAWQVMYEAPTTELEHEILSSLPPEPAENPEKEWFLDLMYHLIKKRGVETGVSAALLLSRTDFNKMKTGEMEDSLLNGWRGQVLGPELVHWLRKQGKISVTWEDHACILRMK